MVKAADPSVSTPVKDLKIETNFFLFSTTEHQKPFNPSESSIKCNISSQYIHSQRLKYFQQLRLQKMSLNTSQIFPNQQQVEIISLDSY